MAEQEARELVDEQKRFLRLDREAQNNPDDPRWWAGTDE